MFDVTLRTCIILVLTSYLDVFVSSRAIMVEPPHRSSLWRFNYNTTVNLRDDSLNCGGYDWQWGVNGGRCGLCGDRWNGIQENDDNGKYSSGIIVRSYIDGHYINATFEVSSNHLGYVEFRLCPRNSTTTKLDQACFDTYPLWIDESHGTRYHIGSRGGIYDLHIRLPGGLTCKKCVLQWKYKTGYRYNGDNQCKCQGCGYQEQFINCADIEIKPMHGWSHVPDVSGHAHTHGSHAQPVSNHPLHSSNLTSLPFSMMSHMTSHHGRMTSPNRRIGPGSAIFGPRDIIRPASFQQTSSNHSSGTPSVQLKPSRYLARDQTTTTTTRVTSQSPPSPQPEITTTSPIIAFATAPSYDLSISSQSSLSTSSSVITVPSSMTSQMTSRSTMSQNNIQSIANTTQTVNVTQTSPNNPALGNIRKQIVSHIGTEISGEMKPFFGTPQKVGAAMEPVAPSPIAPAPVAVSRSRAINTNGHIMQLPRVLNPSVPSASSRSNSRTNSMSNSMSNSRSISNSNTRLRHGRRQQIAGFRTFTKRPTRPDVPNTQFVSVSNILDRFYPKPKIPNNLAPLLYSLARPRPRPMNLGAGCDVNSDEFRCKARGIYNHSPGISRWCEINCKASNCVSFMCECGCEDTSRRKPQSSGCHAIADFHGVEGMDEWCTANCKVGYCPANTCSVEDCLLPA